MPELAPVTNTAPGLSAIWPPSTRLRPRYGIPLVPTERSVLHRAENATLTAEGEGSQVPQNVR